MGHFGSINFHEIIANQIERCKNMDPFSDLKSDQKVGYFDPAGSPFCQDAKTLISGPNPKMYGIRLQNTKRKKRF